MTSSAFTQLLMVLLLIESQLVKSWLAPSNPFRQQSILRSSKAEIEDEEWLEAVDLEVLQGDDDDFGDTEDDWIPDAAKAQKKTKDLIPAKESKNVFK